MFDFITKMFTSFMVAVGIVSPVPVEEPIIQEPQVIEEIINDGFEAPLEIVDLVEKDIVIEPVSTQRDTPTTREKPTVIIEEKAPEIVIPVIEVPVEPEPIIIVDDVNSYENKLERFNDRAKDQIDDFKKEEKSIIKEYAEDIAELENEISELNSEYADRKNYFDFKTAPEDEICENIYSRRSCDTAVGAWKKENAVWLADFENKLSLIESELEEVISERDSKIEREEVSMINEIKETQDSWNIEPADWYYE